MSEKDLKLTDLDYATGDHISTFVKPVPESALYATVHFAVPSAVHTGSNGTQMLRFSGAISTQSQITSLSS